MHLGIVGLNHKTAPVEVRERLSIRKPQLHDALAHLSADARISECLILSTCNRTEVYFCANDSADCSMIADKLSDFCSFPADQFSSHLYSHSDREAAAHLFRVAAGLDSMILGEAQILGQVKDSYAESCRKGVSGPILNTLFQQAITVGKRARTETEIGSGSFSIGSIAAQLAASVFNSLQGKRVLVVGAGNAGKLAIDRLVPSCAEEILIANRNYERAVDLAERFHGTPIGFENLVAALSISDLVITSTGAGKPIFTREMVEGVMKGRAERPICFIDIAVPRDIEPAVSEIDKVFLYDIDDLEATIEGDLEKRISEVAKTEAIIVEEIGAFERWFAEADAAPVIAALREKLEGIKLQEMDRLKAKIPSLSDREIAVIDRSMHSLIDKICHQPMARIKASAAEDGSAAELNTICRLFGLSPGHPQDTPESQLEDAIEPRLEQPSGCESLDDEDGDVVPQRTV